ncbi:DUF4190 domain-containing protein [Microbacterium lacus]|uniref:DUF4190 domain-containing protein n=1 Tax=Microbacterium lacus TaxID=415217 RepID=UPI00384FEC30
MTDPTSSGADITPSDTQPTVPYAPPTGPAYGHVAPPAYGQAAPPAFSGPTPPPYGSAPAYGGAAPAYGSVPVYGNAPAYGAYGAAKTNTLAVVSLIASIAGMLFVPFIGSLVGVITGHMSLSQITRTSESGRGMALAGTIIGWVGVGLSVVGIIVLLALIPWMLTFSEISTA